MRGVLLLCVLAGCAPAPRGASAVDLRPCALDDVSLDAMCGRLEVFEDRAAQSGRKISLNIAVVPSLRADPEPDPLFLLVGGPGQSATKSGAPLAALLRGVRRHREIVLVDQRGTGKSNPLLCTQDTQGSLAATLDVELQVASIRDCARDLDADPRHYTTPVAMDDLDDVRAALGYERINLWGGSYGTRAALEYMRRHPGRVRRVVLDGPAPTDLKLTVHAGRDAQRALDLLFARCASDPACHTSFGDLRATFDAMLARLEAEPEHVELRHPLTGDLEAFKLTRHAVAAAVRSMLYVPHLVALLPIAIQRGALGDWGPLMAGLVTVSGSVESDMADGMFLSVVCAEDVPRITAAEREKLGDNFLGDVPVALLIESCAVWPAAQMPDEYFLPIDEPHPTLVLSGELDPVVPPQWGELVASRLPNARHVVISGAAHGVTALPCVSSAVAEFFHTSAPTQVDVGCEERPATPLLLNMAGASP